MIIKVCGMKEAGNIADVIASGADWIGFIFYPPSPRYMSQIPTMAGTMPDRGRQLQVQPGTKKAGVFVDDTSQGIITHIVNFELDIIQLHGNETPTFIRNLRRTIAGGIRPDIKIIKTISIRDTDDLKKSYEYEDCADMLLFDTQCTTAGGSGRQFDWSMLGRYQGRLPFILSGGIGPGDEGKVAALEHPRLAGIDLNSRFETSPGIKDATLIGQFTTRLRQLTAARTNKE